MKVNLLVVGLPAVLLLAGIFLSEFIGVAILFTLRPITKRVGVQKLQGQHKIQPLKAITPPSQLPLLRRGLLEWLHLPKAGTSFGNTLVLWACPELATDTIWVAADGVQLPNSCLTRFRVSSRPRQAIGDHISLTNRTDEELGRVVTLLRYPPARIASLYHHVNHHTVRDSNHLTATEEEMCSWLLGSPWGAHVRGGMVRFVAGIPMVRDPDLKGYLPGPQELADPEAAIVREACRRLGLFAFVGITEFWDASVCLFHEMHGGRTHAVELQNVRAGGYQQHPHAVKQAGCGDTADMQLFECGLRIFWQNMEAHPQCKKLLPDVVPGGLSWPGGWLGRGRSQ